MARKKKTKQRARSLRDLLREQKKKRRRLDPGKDRQGKSTSGETVKTRRNTATGATGKVPVRNTWTGEARDCIRAQDG
jgi:hypothetical protein